MASVKFYRVPWIFLAVGVLFLLFSQLAVYSVCPLRDGEFARSESVALTAALNSTTSDSGVRVIAFYFPQFHAFEENDRFWGKGFTEWTRLREVKTNRFGRPLRQPTELGYYNLLDVSVRAAQAKLARQYGVFGFAYYHYWFGVRGALMDGPLQRMLVDGEPDIPFCFCWANEPWSRRWDGGTNDLLIGQEYGDESDWRTHFEFLLPFFAHRRYIKNLRGEPIFLVYRLGHMPQTARSGMVALWNRLIREQTALPGLAVVQCWNPTGNSDSREPLPEAAAVAEFHVPYQPTKLPFDTDYWSWITHLPRKHVVQYRGGFSAWDNTPRHIRDGAATNYLNDDPREFYLFLCKQFRRLRKERANARQPYDDFFFLNAWNEWGEGNVLEPDSVDGRRRLEAVREAIRDCSSTSAGRQSPSSWQQQFGYLPVSSGRKLEAIKEQVRRLENRAAECGAIWDQDYYLLRAAARGNWSKDQDPYAHWALTGLEAGFPYRYIPAAQRGHFSDSEDCRRLLMDWQDPAPVRVPHRPEEIDACRSSRGDLPLAFIHTPKTAGTATRGMIQYGTEVHGKRLYKHEPPENDFYLASQETKSQVEVVIGHLQYGDLARYWRPDFEYVTVLRHPVERAISEYFYLHTTQSHPAYSYYKNRSLEALAQKGWPGSTYPAYYGGDVATAKRVLERALVVGIYEMMPATLAQFETAVPWLNASHFRKINTTPPHEEIGSELRTKLANNLEDDMAIYAFALRILKTRAACRPVPR